MYGHRRVSTPTTINDELSLIALAVECSASPAMLYWSHTCRHSQMPLSLVVALFTDELDVG